MSDILLSVGLQTGATETSQIQTDLQRIISQIDSDPPRVRVGLQVDQTAINHFRSQLTHIVNSISLSNGAPITVNISGLGEITANATRATDALNGVTNAARNVGNAAREGNNRLVAGTIAYNEALTSINQLLIQVRSNYMSWSASATGEANAYHAALGNQISALESLELRLSSGELSAREFRTELSEIRAIATDAAEAIRAVGENHTAISPLVIGTQEYNNALARCHSLLAQISGNQHAWTAARVGSSRGAYESLSGSVEQLNELIETLRRGGLSADEFAQRFSRINAEVKEATAAIKMAGENVRAVQHSVGQNSDIIMSAKQSNDAIAEINRQLISMQANHERWTAAANGQSKEAYTTYGTQIQALEQLKTQVQSNTISWEQYRERLSAIKLAASDAAVAINKVGEDHAAKNITVLGTNTEEYRTALAKCSRELATLRKNQAQWTAAANGRGAADYKALGQYERAMETLTADLMTGKMTLDDFTTRFHAIKSAADTSRASIRGFGEDTKSLGDRLKGLAGKFGAWLSVSQLIMQAIRAIRQMVTAVRDVDKAMTELKKVTNETGDTYNRFLENASTRAKQIGAPLSDVVNASADFARLGYGLEDAAKLADAALIYKNIGEGIEDITTASKSIISTMQAFGIEASNVMSIVDKFNEVGNNFAISSAGIGEAMQRSAAAMASANNTIEETIALITAANTIVQNPESVGKTLPNNAVMRCKKTAISVKGRRRSRPRKDFVVCARRVRSSTSFCYTP